MTTFNKKRTRISSPVSDSDDEDQGNPKTHENGENGGKVRILRDNKGGDTEDRLKSNTCYVCDGEDNWVLECQGEECPIAIHQSCISNEPDFDEFGNFYCPYCWYKRVVVKSVKLRKKLMMIENSRKGRETLGGVDLGLMTDEGSEEMENVVEVNVSGGRRIASVSLSGNRRECDDESYERFMVMEKNQRMKEVADETQSREVSETGDDDVDKGRFNEKNEETLVACNSNAGERREGRASGSEKSHEKAQAHNFVAGINTRKQRRYNEKSQQSERRAGTHEKDIFINDEGTEARDFDLGEGRSGKGCYHENNQQQKASSTESCAQEAHTTYKRVSRGSGFGDRRYRQERHIEKNLYNKTVETETQEKEVSKDGKRKREGAVVRGGDEFDLARNQDQQSQADMRNDDATFNAQEDGLRKDEQVERNSVSSISSPMSTDNVNDSNAASRELALIIHPNAGVQERPIEARPIKARPFCSIPPNNPSFQPQKYGHKSDPGQRSFVLCSDKKRKRLFWTQAEEEMLRVGVQKFPGVRNIPWRKILEFGRDVFHDERAPSDLKDKWKKMNKMSLETGKWVSLSNERHPIH